MDLPNVPYVLFPKVGQWIMLVDWDYSHVKISEIDQEGKKFRAQFLIPPKHDIPRLNYPEVDGKEWIPFERIKTTLRKFWEPAMMEMLELELAGQISTEMKQL